MIKKLSFILLFIISASGLAQVTEKMKEQIEIKSFNIDLDLGKRVLKKKYKIDSIKVKSDRYQNKITSVIKFKKSRESIDLDIYFENDKLLMIRTTEYSPKFKSYENAIQVKIIYFEKGIKIDQKVRTGIPKGLHEIGIPKDFNRTYGYDKNFTPELMLEISKQIIEKTAE